MVHLIKRLIAEGEHQMQDFKFEISDSRKIARTLVAFANTDGGRLLIGVKDNGVIAGVRSEEEFYMAEGAARLHCHPEVPIAVKEWDVDGKKVLEIIIKRSKNKPHYAPDPEGVMKAYIRQEDQNFVANTVQLMVWELERHPGNTIIRYREEEKLLLEHLDRHQRISLGKFQRLAGLTKTKAEVILVSFIMLGLIRLRHEGEQVYYHLVH